MEQDTVVEFTLSKYACVLLPFAEQTKLLGSFLIHPVHHS